MQHTYATRTRKWSSSNDGSSAREHNICIYMRPIPIQAVRTICILWLVEIRVSRVACWLNARCKPPECNLSEKMHRCGTSYSEMCTAYLANRRLRAVCYWVVFRLGPCDYNCCVLLTSATSKLWILYHTKRKHEDYPYGCVVFTRMFSGYECITIKWETSNILNKLNCRMIATESHVSYNNYFNLCIDTKWFFYCIFFISEQSHQKMGQTHLYSSS